MEIIKGKIAQGYGGLASRNLKNIKPLIQERIGLPELIDGTLNIKTHEYYAITAVDDIIRPNEYKNQKESIKLKRCRINGSKGVIIRPSQHDNPKNEELWFRIEIMSHHKLKEKLNLKIGDEVEIEVESGIENENDWWNAPEIKKPITTSSSGPNPPPSASS